MRREQGFSREDVMGHEIRGKTLGLVGIGHVGTRVAALARAFGMEVIATDPLLDAGGDRPPRRRAGARWTSCWRSSDFVSLHCPRDADHPAR